MIHHSPIKVYCRYEPRPIGYCLTFDSAYLYGQMTHESWQFKVSRNPANTFVIQIGGEVYMSPACLMLDAWWAASYVTPRAGVSVPHLPASHGRSEARHDRGRRDSRTTGRDQAVASSSPTREHQCIADMRETFKCSYMTHCIRVKHFVTKSCALEKCSY